LLLLLLLLRRRRSDCVGCPVVMSSVGN